MRGAVKYGFFLSLCLVFILFSVIFVDGALLGVNRASLTFDDVLRGGYAEQEVVVSIGQPNDVLVSFEARGDIADWISFEPVSGSFFVNENNPGTITVVIEPPSDAQVDSYEGVVFISTGSLSNVSSAMGTNVVVAFEVDVLVNLTDTQILSCTAGGFDLSDSEVGERNTIRANVRNTGNVRVRPSFDVRVFSQMQDDLLSEFSYSHDSDIIPTKSSIVEGEVEFGLEPGQYWAEVSDPVCGSRSLVTFSVLKRGGISDDGNLKKLSSVTWASVNDIVPITASFVNEGARTISAQFKGVITSGDRVVELVESDVVNVPSGDEFDFVSYFEPSSSGQYRVSGRVHFNNKVTFERGTIINVNELSDENVVSFDFIGLIFSIVIIVFSLLVFLILKKKKKKKKF